MIDRSEVLDPGVVRGARAAALDAWLSLQHALALRPERALEALRRGGDPRAALAAGGLEPLPAAELSELRRRLRTLGALAVPWGSAAYPACLARLPDAPPLLLVRGDPGALAGPCVAIVGSRAASAYGRDAARRFAGAFAAAGYVVVSGLAAGIDGIAHEAALAAGGRTLAVLACGPERIYPARHRGLAGRILRAGALATEFPLDTPPRAPHFPLRNRVISGLSAAVLVVEARERSGSLVTAGLAARQGVDVWAVPGPIDAPTSAGTNRLLSEGAGVALAPETVLEELARHAPAPPPVAPPAAAARAAPPRVAPELVAVLRDGPQTRDALARRLGRAPGELALDLLELELAGRVREDRDGRLRLVSARER